MLVNGPPAIGLQLSRGLTALPLPRALASPGRLALVSFKLTIGAGDLVVGPTAAAGDLPRITTIDVGDVERANTLDAGAVMLDTDTDAIFAVSDAAVAAGSLNAGRKL